MVELGELEKRRAQRSFERFATEVDRKDVAAVPCTIRALVTAQSKTNTALWTKSPLHTLDVMEIAHLLVFEAKTKQYLLQVFFIV